MTSNETLTTVEPEQLGVQIQEGRISAKEITESSQLHVIDPKCDSNSPAAILFVEAEGIWSEITLHAVDVEAILGGLREVIADGQ